MNIFAIICVLLTWQGQCVATGPIAHRVDDWSPKPCRSLLPVEVQPFVVTCRKVREVML